MGEVAEEAGKTGEVTLEVAIVVALVEMTVMVTEVVVVVAEVATEATMIVAVVVVAMVETESMADLLPEDEMIEWKNFGRHHLVSDLIRKRVYRWKDETLRWENLASPNKKWLGMPSYTCDFPFSNFDKGGKYALRDNGNLLTAHSSEVEV